MVTVNIAWTYGSYSQVSQKGSVTIDGVKTEFNSTFNYNRTQTGSQTLFTKQQVITHTADGTKTLYVSAAYHNGGQTVKDVYASGSKVLTPIPRATTPVLSASEGYMGQTVSITLDRAVDTFTHVLSYAFGDQEGLTDGLVMASQTAATLTPPVTLAGLVTTADMGPCVITCTTYDGDNLIGSRSSTLTLHVPEDMLPVISSVTVAEATDGIAAQFNTYVQTKSTLDIHIAAAGVSGSTVASYRTTVQGVVYTDPEFTTPILAASGASVIVVEVIDTRGRTATREIPLSVLEYFPPRLDSMRADRINQAGTLDDEGDRVGITASFAIAPVGDRNVHSYTAQYRRSGDSAWTTFDTGAASWEYDGTKKYTDAPFISTDYPYTIRLILTDFFGSIQADYDIAVAYALMDWRETGRGVSFGKVSEKDGMEIDMTVHLTGDVRDGDGDPYVWPISQGGTGATTPEDALAALGAHRWTLVWENLTPTVDFAAQTITGLDWSGYDLYLAIMKDGKQYDYAVPAVIGPIGWYGEAFLILGTTQWQLNRGFKVNANSIEVFNCDLHTGSLTRVSNDRLIPYRFYGIKL